MIRIAPLQTTDYCLPKAVAQLLRKLLDVRFFDDVQMAAGYFVDVDAAACQRPPTLKEIN